jgi:hypothetical protein
MMQTMNRILKSDEVEIDGMCHLGIGHSVSSAQLNRNNNITAAKAKILDNNNEYALIELTCSCGQKTLVRCEYGETIAAKGNQPAGAVNQKKP